MAEFLAPDVYVEEVQGRSAQVGSPSTSTFAIAGYSPRGPEGRAMINGSFKEFSDRFGGFSAKSLNAYIAASFFQNGGSRLVFVRQLHGDAVLAQAEITGKWTIKATGRGVWANDMKVTLSGNPNFYNLETGEFSKFKVDVEAKDTSGALVLVETYDAVDLIDEESPEHITKTVNGISEFIVIEKIAGGIPASMAPQAHTGLALGMGDGEETHFTATLTQIPVAAGSVKIKAGALVIATDNGLGGLSGAGVTGTINYETGALDVVVNIAPADGIAVTADVVRAGALKVSAVLAGGSDGSMVEAADLTAISLKAEKKGIYALDTLDEQMQLALPDFAGSAEVTLALVGYAESRKDILILCEPAKGYSPQQAVTYRRNTLKSVSSYAACYYPWVNVPDPLNKNRPKLIPPCGHVAGRMAYTDQNENVGKAPAGMIRGQLNFLTGVERVLSKTEMGLLYQAQINPIRSDANVGTAIFGNKTLQVAGDFTEVNVRRLFVFLEKSQYAGLLDILFENIGPVTFGIVKTRLDSFLENLYLSGVIGSGAATKEQAFKVICDDTNNTAATQTQKKIVIDQFVKPNMAAEFIHLRLQRVFDATEV